MLERDAGLCGDVSEGDLEGLLAQNGFLTQRRKGAKKNAKENDFPKRFIHCPSSAPCLLTLSTSRAACRLRFCVQRRCTHDRAENERGPDRVAGAPRSRGSRHCPLRRPSVAALCRAHSAHQRSRAAPERCPAST